MHEPDRRIGRCACQRRLAIGLQQAAGWPGDLRYYFPTQAEFLAAIDPWFMAVDHRCGAYSLSGRCPTFRLRPR
ncbi:hypothetical protein STVA_09770 [Allostella vacuolata]|nr:hypothetical protein STVA_09770 [Stella vacuolata]